MSSVILIRTDALPDMPKAVQQYVADWFRATGVLGIEVMQASTLLHFDARDYERHFRKGHGVAPGHSVELQSYTEGLGKRDLLGWLYEHAETGSVAFICTIEERHNECLIDED